MNAGPLSAYLKLDAQKHFSMRYASIVFLRERS